MKTLRFIPRLPAKALTCLALVTMAAGLAQAQPFTNFNSGSTGTVDLIITSNTTITLPPEGILHYRSISISNGATVKFTRNPLNTPVYLLAQSNVVINGTIDVSGDNGNGIYRGLGGPGGFDGGYGGITPLEPIVMELEEAISTAPPPPPPPKPNAVLPAPPDPPTNGEHNAFP